MRRSSISMVKNTRASVIVSRSKTTRRWSTRSFVSVIRGSLSNRADPVYHSGDESAQSGPKSYHCEHAMRSCTRLLTALFQTVGLLVGSMIVAQQIVNNKLDPSYFVFFVTYLAQVSRIILDSPNNPRHPSSSMAHSICLGQCTEP